MVHFAEINLPPPPLLNVAVYWKSSNPKACAKNLSQIPANNTDNGGRGIGLRIYVRYYGLPLIGNVLKPLAKSVLIPLGLTAAALATDAAIHKQIFRFVNTILIISNKEMNGIIIKSLEESGFVDKNC